VNAFRAENSELLLLQPHKNPQKLAKWFSWSASE